MRTVGIIAWQELQDGLRNRWIVSATLLLLALALSLIWLGATPVGSVGASPFVVSVVSLSSLSVFLLPLLGLMLSYDAVVGESERGTLLLLLAYPVRRWQFLAGKFVGHSAVLAIAVALGYGVAGAALFWRTADVATAELAAFAVMMASSVLLGMAFVAIGFLLSTVVRERATAAGMAIGVWLVIVVVYDFALLGLLTGGAGDRIGRGLFNALLLVNPTDAYRLLNLTSFSRVADLAGVAGLVSSGTATAAAAILCLAAWVAVPLAAAGLVFARTEP